MTLEVYADGRLLAGYSSVTVTRSILSTAATWSIKYQGDAPGALDAGKIVDIRWNGTPIVAGYVETYARANNATTSGADRGGRSYTGDVVDCDATLDGGTIRNTTLADVATRLCDVVGVTVSLLDPGVDNELIRKFSVSPGETIDAAIRRLAEKRGLLVFADGDGHLVIGRVGAGPALLSISWPEHLKASSLTLDTTRRFSRWEVVGQAHATDQWSEGDARAARGSADDPGVTRTRLKRIVAKGQVSRDRCQVQAEWMRNKSVGSSLTYEATVDGLSKPKSRSPWEPGEVVHVSDPRVGIEGSNLLITGVSYTLSATQDEARLTMTHPQAYAALEEPTPPKPERLRPGVIDILDW